MTGIVTIFQYIISGLAQGSIYAVVAIGFNIIYNSTGIINFAQGEFVVLGAMVSITFSAIFPLWAAIAMGIAVASLYGALVEIVFVKYARAFSPLRAICLASIVFILVSASGLFSFLHPVLSILFGLAVALPFGAGGEFLLLRFQKEQNVLQLIIITIGVSILTRETMKHVWGKDVFALRYFTGTAITTISVGGVYISPQLLWVLGTVTLVVAGLYLFYKYTLVGKAMRAVSLDRKAAQLCGINARLLVTLSFILSAAIGALAGAVTSPQTSTDYKMGSSFAINGFTVAILGGLGNSFAAALAGLLLGVLESFTTAIVPSSYKEVVVIIIMLLILFFKPSGLFGKREERTLKEF
ncbi:MAG: branched-chain amino acid ABC transporter permease [Spirochaetales bacterium]|nr:branched-chain amino acid ABC transporter permease [Spirochaetales bacterium]